jgi:pantoate--beta-alanine ligase
MHEILTFEDLAVVGYVSVADAETLEELDHVDSSAIASLAVRIGQARLIDNIVLESSTTL